MNVFVAGGTGYIGQRLVPALLARGHRVRVLARQTSLNRIPAGAIPVVGDALRESTLATALRRGETIVHLVGTPHPSPAKAAEFERVDLASVVAASSAAQKAGAVHFIYVSVAHPAPTMRAYIAVRQQGEQLLASAKLTRTILRPWYVLGPGHRWPVALLPVYALARLLPPFREGAERLGLVTLSQMVRALVAAVEQPPPTGTARILDVPAIRAARLPAAAASPKRSPSVGVP